MALVRGKIQIRTIYHLRLLSVPEQEKMLILTLKQTLR